MRKHDFSIRERIPFRAENSPLFHQVPKGGLIQEITPVLSGTLVIAGGAASGVATGAENPGGLVQRFDLDAVTRIGSPYPAGKLKSVTPRSVLRRRIFDKGFFQPDLSIGAAGLTGAAGSFTLSMPFPLRFSLPGNANRAIETALNADQYDSLQLQIVTGGKSALLTGNDRNWDYSGVRFDIYDRRENGAPGDTAVLYESDQFVPIAGANPRLPLGAELPQSESFLDVLLITETTNAALADTILRKVNVSTGTEQFEELYSEMIKQHGREFVTDAAQVDTGLYLVPISQDGLLAGAVRPISLLLDVANPGGAGVDRITVNSRRVVLPGEYKR
jgi:hypothetical protein